MENCFDVGENEKKNALYTPHSCQALMYEKLEKDFTLTERQIVRAIFKRGNGESGNVEEYRGTGNVGEYRGIFKRWNIGESLKRGISGNL